MKRKFGINKTTKVQQRFSKKQEFCGIAVKKKIKININPGFQKSCSSLSHKTLYLIVVEPKIKRNDVVKNDVKMTDKEKSDLMNWNYLVALYTKVKDKVKEPLGSVEFIEAMLKEAKLMELILAENFSQKSLDTDVQVLYNFHQKSQP